MKSTLTKSARQTLIFFEEFVRRREVVDFIQKYRKELNIPADGIIFSEEDEKALSDPAFAFLYIPQRIHTLLSGITREKPIRIINACNVFTRQQGVDSVYISTLLRLYLFFNKTIESVVEIFDNWNDLLRLEHIPSELSWFDDEDHFLLKLAYKHFENIGKKYPVALYINPEASQRQIQDFISKKWTYIQAHKTGNKNRITRLRKKSARKQERNDFIYKNRDLPRRRIMEITNDDFPDLGQIDYGSVGKIISLEKKRREHK